MKKMIILAFSILLLLPSLVSAINITAGGSYSFTLGKPYKYYSIVGNSTDVYLEIIKNETNITINFNKYMNDDFFSVIFFDEEDEVIYSYLGGNSKTVYKNVTQNITQPQPQNITQEKIVYAQNNTCIQNVTNQSIEKQEDTKPKEENKFISALKTPIGIAVIVLSLLLIGLTIFIKQRKKANRSILQKKISQVL